MVLVTKRPVDGSFRVATEVVDLVRLRAHVLRLGAPFLGRLFTRAEVAAAEGSAVDVIASLGTALAVKKALVGLLGGQTRIPLTSIELAMEHGEWATIRLQGEAESLAEARRLMLVDLAVSRSGQVAMASVIVQSGLPSGSWPVVAR